MSTITNNILYVVAQGLTIPVMVVLILLMIITLVCVGSVLVEYFTERNHYKVVMPLFIAAIEDCPDDDPARMEDVIESSSLLRRQKNALAAVTSYMDMPHDALTSLAKTYMTDEADYYNRKLALTNTIAKIAPMFGLMGTLIPLGPGITALSSGDLTTLSTSLSIAFDTTVAGLISAAICVILTKVRERWYKKYLAATEAAMNCILEKADFLHGVRTPDEVLDKSGDKDIADRFAAVREGQRSPKPKSADKAAKRSGSLAGEGEVS